MWSLRSAALFAAAPLQSQASRITAQEITIVDSSGKARGTWAGDTGIVLSNSALTLNNALGERRLLVNVADDEPTVYFLDKAGKTRMYFDVSAAGAARLGMSDSQLKQRVFLTVDDQRNPALILNDEAGNRRMVLNVEKDEPIHAFYDEIGRAHV